MFVFLTMPSTPQDARFLDHTQYPQRWGLLGMDKKTSLLVILRFCLGTFQGASGTFWRYFNGILEEFRGAFFFRYVFFLYNIAGFHILPFFGPKTTGHFFSFFLTAFLTLLSRARRRTRRLASVRTGRTDGRLCFCYFALLFFGTM